MKKLLTIIAIMLITSNAFAAIGYLGAPRARYWTKAGNAALAGGKVVTCEAGASCGCTDGSYTARASYTDSTGLVQNSNPVVLNAYGEASIWLDGTYKITVCSSSNVLQWTMDGVTGVQDSSTTLTEWPDTGLSPTFINTTTFSVPGDHTTDYFSTGRRIKTSNPSGTIYSTVTSSTSYGVSVTNVVVVNDSGVLEEGISAVYVSILDSAHVSAPILPIVTKTSGYTLTPADIGKTFVFNLSSAATVTLPAASAVPSGAGYSIKTTPTGSVVTVAGTVSGIVNPTVSNTKTVKVISDATSWYLDAGRPAQRGCLVYTTATPTAQSFPSGNTTVAWFNSTDHDTDNIFSASTSSTRLMVPNGVSKVRLSGGPRLSSAASSYAYIYKNGSSSYNGFTVITGTNPIFSGNTPILSVVGGNYFELAVNPGAVTTTAASGMWFSMEIIE